VAGSHPVDKWLENRARKDFKPWEGRLDFRYLSGMPLEEILAAVSVAPSGSIVYITSFAREVSGKFQTTMEVARRIGRVSNAPVFGILDILLGNGIVGGSLIDFKEIGTKAGETVLDVLREARPAEVIPTALKVSQVDTFDWRELKRWNLSESALPRGSVIVNREFSIWDLKYYAIGVLALILAQSFLISRLLIQRRRRRLAEESVWQKSQELNQFFNVTTDLLCIADHHGYFLRLNPIWESTLGFTMEELMGKRFFDFVHQDDVEETQRAIVTLESLGRVIHFENRCRCKDGSYRWLEWSASQTGNLIFAAARDVTERKKTETEIRQHREEIAHVARVAAMGELTTSLAHEINQPLAAILTNAEAARQFLSLSEPDISEVREILDDIVQDDKRASDVISRVRALVRKEEPHEEALDLNKLIQEVVGLVQGDSLLVGLSIAVELSPELKPIQGDRTRLQQVVLNLILNGAAAMRNTSRSDRKIIVRTAMVDDVTVKVSVTDFGIGIDEEDTEQLFEPFYTSKPEGLGMGLSISRTIIKEHGGIMEARNNPAGGATFAFVLPAHQGDNP
jgi:PAS domain S-box-containing protein